jgi:alkylation response protein AidB-like acyl-CoA dehydrogenase
MDFNLTSDQSTWEEKATIFAQNEIAPCVSQLEEDLAFRAQLFHKMGKENFFLLFLQDTLSYLLALKNIAKVDAGIAVAMAVTNMVAEAISFYGDETQKEKYLRAIANGELVPASFALTENMAGSDARNLQMIANKVGSAYFLQGEKKFITNGDMAGVLIVIAKTAPDQMTAFLVDRGATGMSVIKKERKLGLLTANLVALRFERCPAQILGKLGEGFKIAMRSLDSRR